MKPRSPERLLSDMEAASIPVPECGCWLWIKGADKDGYGQVWFKGSNHRAHRVSWMLANGGIPKGMQVMHKCDTPSCINPHHLSLGTNAENAADRDRKCRHRVQSGDNHYMRRNPLLRSGEKRGGTSLTEADVRSIRTLLSSGATQAAICKQFSVSRTCISAIATKRTWSHI